MVNNQKGFAHLLLVIVVFVVGVGGLLYYSWQKGLIKTTSQNVISPTPSDTKDVSVDTENWKTYSDQKLRFSIKYPETVKILRSFPEVSGVEFVRKEDFEKDYLEITMLVIYFRGKEGSDPEQVFRDSDCGKPCNEKTENVKINNAVGIRTLGPRYPYEHNYYLTDQNKKVPVVRISLVPNPVDPNKDITLLAQILSTFKFLGSEGSEFENSCLSNKGNWNNEYKECSGLTDEVCETLGGKITCSYGGCSQTEDGGLVCTGACIKVCKIE